MGTGRGDRSRRRGARVTQALHISRSHETGISTPRLARTCAMLRLGGTSTVDPRAPRRHVEGFALPIDVGGEALAVQAPLAPTEVGATPSRRCGGGTASLADRVGYPMPIPNRWITIGTFLAEAFEGSMIGRETIAEANAVGLLERAVSPGETAAFLVGIAADGEVARGDIVFMPLRDTGIQSQALRPVARRTAPVETTDSRVAEEPRRMRAAGPWG